MILPILISNGLKPFERINNSLLSTTLSNPRKVRHFA
jgi:hypothetical protein